MYDKLGFIVISASNSTDDAKKSSDFVCTGKNDELVLQKVIDECQSQNKNIYLLNGIYKIDGFYDFRIKCIASHGSSVGRPGAFSPLVDFNSQAILRASVRMVCIPSLSIAASPGVLP